jgi:UDP-N-acetylmuramoyl-L-alanyl-D-glutamate--2,6-diaminopimelate ligase
MAGIASSWAIKLINTSDNRQTGKSEIHHEENGKRNSATIIKKTVAYRKTSYKAKCQLAQPNDIILICRKGHETYQEINGIRMILMIWNS